MCCAYNVRLQQQQKCPVSDSRNLIDQHRRCWTPHWRNLPTVCSHNPTV
jgi:hypothetical protein